MIKVPIQKEHTRTPEFISLYSRVPKYLMGKEIILTMKALSTKKSPGQQYLAKKTIPNTEEGEIAPAQLLSDYRGITSTSCLSFGQQ